MLTQLKLVNEFKELLSHSHRSQADLNVRFIQKLKIVFREVAGLKAIPPKHRDEVDAK
jgi:hypothetical protein